MIYETNSPIYSKENNIIVGVFNQTIKSSEIVETSTDHNEKKLNEDLRWGVKPRRKLERKSNWGV